MRTPVNQKTLTQHFTYNWWKYLLLILFSIFGVNMLYTVTAYRAPAEKKITFYVYGYADTDSLDAYMEEVRKNDLPDMEEMRSFTIMNEGYYGSMQLTTYLAAGEGNLYLLPRDQFISMASEGAFLPLENDEELMALFNEAGISLQSGWRKNTEEGETHLYGIPQSKLPGLTRYAWADGGYLGIAVTGQNEENTLTFLRILCRDMIKEPAPQDRPTEEPEK